MPNPIISMKTCANCGTAAEASAGQCGRCGMSLPDAASAPEVAGAAPLGPSADAGPRLLRWLEMGFALTLIGAGLALLLTGVATIAGWVLIGIGALGLVGLGVF